MTASQRLLRCYELHPSEGSPSPTDLSGIMDDRISILEAKSGGGADFDQVLT
jgi:hypothetical protein